MDYRQGRLISVIGPVFEVRQSAIGEARYRYPVVSPEKMHLWRSAYYGSQPSVFFGVGIGVHAR